MDWRGNNRSLLGRAAFTAAVVVLFAVIAPGRPSLVITADADATLIEPDDGADEPADGLGGSLCAGTDVAGKRRRALLRFDLRSVPPIARVESAALRLSAMDATGDAPIRVHRVRSAWSEGVTGGQLGQRDRAAAPNDPTWGFRAFGFETWSAPGGDFIEEPSAQRTTEPGEGGASREWTGPGLVGDVGAWVRNPGANHGWILIADESSPGVVSSWHSRESDDAPRRPTLIVEFSLPDGYGACCLDIGACVYCTKAVCDAQGGEFRGTASACAPGTCPQPPGACCMPSGACALVTPEACRAVGGTSLGGGTSCGILHCPVPLARFVDPLPIPPTLRPVRVDHGVAHYEVSAREFTQRIHRDLPPTRLWGYASRFPGPTIEAVRGVPIRVRWINDLRDASGSPRADHFLPSDPCPHSEYVAPAEPLLVTHVHGARTTSESDGPPDGALPPGAPAPEFEYPNDQPGATLWYHDHALHQARLNIMAGLSGFYIIRDPGEGALGLPTGERDIPLMIQDRSFNADGSIWYPRYSVDSFFGDTNLVNGVAWPFLKVKRGAYRFRVLNAANARPYTLSLPAHVPMVQVATDSGLLMSPVAVDRLTLFPGERVEVVVDFSGCEPGEELALTNSASAPSPGPAPIGAIGDVMKFIVGEERAEPASLSARFMPEDVLTEADADRSRGFVIRPVFSPSCGHDVWMINDLTWDDVTDFVPAGSVEVWSFVNMSAQDHPLHPHLVRFRVLDRQPITAIGGVASPTAPRIAPWAGEQGWKDTVRVDALSITRVVARFDGAPGLYPLHCHALEHGDHEMMRPFKLVPPTDPPGQATDVVPMAPVSPK